LVDCVEHVAGITAAGAEDDPARAWASVGQDVGDIGLPANGFEGSPEVLLDF
jgi:hypothetical protein